MVFHIMPQKESQALSGDACLDNSVFISWFYLYCSHFSLYKLHFLKDAMKYIRLSCTFPVITIFSQNKILDRLIFANFFLLLQ